MFGGIGFDSGHAIIEENKSKYGSNLLGKLLMELRNEFNV